MKLTIPLNRTEFERELRGTRTVIKRNWLTYALLLPVVLVMLLLVWGSLLNGLWMTFHEWGLITDAIWVGLSNYSYVLNWPVFWQSVVATLVFSLVTFIQVGIALVATLALRQVKFRNVVGAAFVIPYTIPGLVSGTLWVYLADPDLGPIFTVLVNNGIIERAIYWSGDGQLAMAMIMFAAAWTYWPLAFIILNASIENIPEEYYETASIFGASKFQTLVNITLPQMKGAIFVALSLRTIYNLTKVSQPLQMTGGGPGYATSILGISVFNFTSARQFGLAMTVGVAMVLLTMLFVIPYIYKFEEQAEAGGPA
jgi:multiple sugar transport system permease protein